MRQQLSLDGPWDFQIDPAGTLALEAIDRWRVIEVPGPWQAQFDDLRLVSGVGWYRRQITVPPDWAGQSIFLVVGAADYFTAVWVNGQPVGEHEGGYLPFEIEISAAVRPGTENEIVMRIVDPGPGAGDIFPDFPFAEIPHGKQSWYGPVGGLWQSVNLEARPQAHIRRVHVTPQGLSGRVVANVQLSAAPENSYLHFECMSPGGERVATVRSGELCTGNTAVQVEFALDHPVLWKLDHPVLYTLDVTLNVGQAPLDQQSARFGVRTFEAHDGRLWLNGHVFYLRGALDQDYYPQGIYTPPSLDFLRQQVRQAKAMGLNCLRCHIKIADPRYLQVADEEGILIWAEVPSWGKRTEQAGQRVRDTWARMVARDWNHPSIVLWTIVNENWGTDLLNSPADRRWLSETVDWARQIDPTRLIVDNSACLINFHVKTDIEDYHFYAAMPEHMDLWQGFVQQFAARAEFTFSPNGDAERSGDEPLIVSEFGNWGLPDLAPLRKAYHECDPWWFDTGSQWSPPVVWPHEVESRFEAAGLNEVFGTWSILSRAAQWAQYRALKYEIETMRAEPALSGYVVTEWSDLHWECNGLVDMARHPRVFADHLADLNADTVIVPRWERLAYWSGEEGRFVVLIAHHGHESYSDAVLHWSLESGEQRGVLQGLKLLPGAVQPAGTVVFHAPEVPLSSLETLVFELARADGQVIARSAQSFSVFAKTLKQAPPSLHVWSDDIHLREWLTAHGYVLDSDQGVRVIQRLDDSTLRNVNAGGRALLCSDESGDIPGLPRPIRVEARHNTPWSGDWASSFAWVNPAITRIPGGPLLDFSWRGAFPEYVITGIAPEHTLAGLFVGWVHLPTALIGRIPCGRGLLTVTTFPVLSPDDSPLRTVLLHDLLRLAVFDKENSS